jgi:serine/threonine protein kinase
VHSNNIVHRDIKPQNILITKACKAKLGDFGVSQLFEKEEEDKISKTEGTYHFMAPECCDRKCIPHYPTSFLHLSIISIASLYTLSNLYYTLITLLPNMVIADVDSFSGKSADIWALGVTLYCMIFNELPFWDDTEFGIIQKIHKEEYFGASLNMFRIKISEARKISPGLRHLLTRMLDKDPLKRATI